MKAIIWLIIGEDIFPKHNKNMELWTKEYLIDPS